MQIKLGKATLKHEDNRWFLTGDSKPNNGACWYDLQVELQSGEKDLAAIARGIGKKIEKEDMKSYICIKNHDSLDVYKKPVYFTEDVSNELNIINAIHVEKPVYVVESVFGSLEGDEPVGALLLSATASVCSIHYIERSENIIWKRELLVFKNGRVKSVSIPEWMYKESGKPDKLIASIDVQVGSTTTISSILEDNVSATLSQGLVQWLEREKAKSKFKILSAVIGCVIAAITYASGVVFVSIAESDTKDLIGLGATEESLKTDLSHLSKDAFLINWIKTPSIITAMRDVTSALGDSARITSMQGKMELGKGVELEGLAQAINGNLKGAEVKGMKMETVVTQGRIGIRFKIQRYLSQKGL